MSWNFLDTEHLPLFIEKLEQIRPDSQPQWGKLTPPALMSHLRFMVELSLGEGAEQDRSNWLTRTLVKWVFFHLLTTWPQGKIKGPPSITPPPKGDFVAERTALERRLKEFVALAQREPNRLTAHPFFGPTPLRYWSRIHGVHFYHHFRQYDV